MKFKIFLSSHYKISIHFFFPFFLLILLKTSTTITNLLQFSLAFLYFKTFIASCYLHENLLAEFRQDTKKGLDCLPLPSRLLSALNLQRKFLNLRFEPRLTQSAPLPSHVSISCFSESAEKFYCSHEETEITRQVQLDDHPSDTWPISLS